MIYEEPRIQARQDLAGQLSRTSELSVVGINPVWRRANEPAGYERPGIESREDLTGQLSRASVLSIT